MNSTQQELPIFKADSKSPNITFLLDILNQADGWVTAAEILQVIGRPNTEANRRSIRALAEASDGAIAGGQLGYMLVIKMTIEQYNHYRNWMTRQADRMTARVLKSDKLFYNCKPVSKPINA